MPKLSLSRSLTNALLSSLWAVCFWFAIDAVGAGERSHTSVPPRDACKGGRQYQSVSMFYSESISRAAVGTPLDAALRYERRQADRIREDAKMAFFTRPPETFATLMEDYTFLVPESLKETYGIGMIIGLSDISSALKYRRSLWRQMIEQFTTVKEAPSDDPYVLKFEVNLDLSFFCRYRQRIQDLVTQR
jgi:hypothetical protein